MGISEVEASSSCCVVAVVVETFRGDDGVVVVVVVVAVGDDVVRSWCAIRMDVGSTNCWRPLDVDERRMHGQDVASGALSGSRRTCVELFRLDDPTWRIADGR